MKTLNPTAHFYTAQELALWLRVTEMTIYRMARRGELPCIRLGRSWRFPSDEIAAFLERSRAEIPKSY